MNQIEALTALNFLTTSFFLQRFPTIKQNKMKFLVVLSVLCISGIAKSLPTRLTEEQFLSATSEADSKSVDIVSGYAQIRRQGRNFASGEKLKFTKPVTVKDPSQFNPPTEAKRVTFDEEKAPIFDLNKMIQEEAEKLKNQVEVASLMAAHAAEQAAANIKSAAGDALGEGSVKAAEVEKIIEAAVDSGIRDAEKIVESEVEQILKEAEVSTEKQEVPVPEVVPEVAQPEIAVPEVATEKVEEVTSQKSANVEWSSDDQTPQEVVTEEVEVKEAVTEAAQETVKVEEPAIEEVEVKATEESPKAEEVATTLAPAEEAKSDSADDSEDSARSDTTETAHPPQDLDLGSVQEV